jgi:hypothetical protein
VGVVPYFAVIAGVDIISNAKAAIPLQFPDFVCVKTFVSVSCFYRAM